MTSDTLEWFENRGVPLKIEEDNRVFPKANTSQVVIDCFLSLSKNLKINILKKCNAVSFYKQQNKWVVNSNKGSFFADKLVIATGSSKQVWNILKKIGHTIVPPVPSLFTFTVNDNIISDLGGVSVPDATVKILGTKLKISGALLITHWGFSGPLILKLSAFGARILSDKNYNYQIEVNWLSYSENIVLDKVHQMKKKNVQKYVSSKPLFAEIPKRLWERLLLASEIELTKKYSELSKAQIQKLSKQLTRCRFQVTGKSTFKDEFVTAGGVSLKEINFKTFESKLFKNLFFVGEALDIDAVTGGFNFQNAWTSGYICSKNIG